MRRVPAVLRCSLAVPSWYRATARSRERRTHSNGRTLFAHHRRRDPPAHELLGAIASIVEGTALVENRPSIECSDVHGAELRFCMRHVESQTQVRRLARRDQPVSARVERLPADAQNGWNGGATRRCRPAPHRAGCDRARVLPASSRIRRGGQFDERAQGLEWTQVGVNRAALSDGREFLVGRSQVEVGSIESLNLQAVFATDAEAPTRCTHVLNTLRTCCARDAEEHQAHGRSADPHALDAAVCTASRMR